MSIAQLQARYRSAIRAVKLCRLCQCPIMAQVYLQVARDALYDLKFQRQALKWTQCY